MRAISRVERVIPRGPSSQVANKQLVIGAEGWEKTSPFLFLSEDWFGRPKGFEEHPHRGMQTVTIVLEGALEHRDHTGAHGILRAGDVQISVSRARRLESSKRASYGFMPADRARSPTRMAATIRCRSSTSGSPRARASVTRGE